MNRHKRLWIVVFLLPAFSVFSFIHAGPLVTTVITSFTRWNVVEPPSFIGFANYARLATSEQFLAALGNTLRWVFFAAFVHVPFGVLVALVLARRRRGWRLTRAVFLIPNVLGWTALSILFRFIYMPEAGIINGVLRAVGLGQHARNWLFHPDTAFAAVTSIWLFFAGVITLITLSELLSIPSSFHDSARIDGASDLQIDWYINLPMIKSISGTGVIIAVNAILQQFEIIFLTTGGGPGNRTMNISVLMVNRIVHSLDYGYANALGVVLLLIGMAAILIVQRTFRLGRAYHE